LEFNGIPLVADKDCPTRLFFLPEDALKSYVLAEMEFADETGSMYISQIEADALEVRVRFFTNLFNEKASASACLKSYISP
jgi:nitric oxide reductase large subunit